MTLTHLSLFSGIGGIDLAAEWVGFKTVAFCEIDPYCQKVLRKHWPDVPIIQDVKDVTKEKIATYSESANNPQQNREPDGERPPFSVRGEIRIESRGCREDRAITLISGGFPCQPHSVAGKRKGSADERNLWPEFRRIIGEIRPKWVLAENVPGLFSSDSGRFFGGVLSDLAALGYSVGWATYGAVDVGALHRRNRVFIMAYSGQVRCGYGGDNRTERYIQGNIGVAAQSQSERNGWVSWTSLASPTLANTGCQHGERAEDNGELDSSLSSQENASLSQRSGCDEAEGIITDSAISRLEGQSRDCALSQGQPNRLRTGGRHPFNVLNTSIKGLPDWAGGEMGQPSPLTEFERPDGTGKEWETIVLLCGMVDGLPGRLDRYRLPRRERVSRLKCLGNAVVPQQIYPILKAIADIEANKCLE